MQSCSHRRKTDWSELPEQSLKCIVKFIGNDVDTLRNFRSVCKNWRHSTAYCIPRSLIVNNKPLFSVVLLLRPRDSTTSPWMVTSVRVAEDLAMFFHPFYGTPLINVPLNFKPYLFHVFSLSSSRHTADSHVVSSLSALFAPKHETGFFSHKFVKKIYFLKLKFDDVVTLSDLVAYTLDRNCNLFKVYVNNIRASKKLALGDSKNGDGDGVSYRKRIVAHFSSVLKLYLVLRRKNRMFKVHQLSRIDADRDVWSIIEVRKFGDYDQDEDRDGLVLFITRDTGFFASAKEFRGCQLRNCIVFSHDAFPPYLNADLELPRDGGGIYVYQLGGTNNVFVPASSYPGFPCDLWSPPLWVLQGSLSQPHSEPEKDQTDQVKKPTQTCQDLVISLQGQKQHYRAATSGPVHEKPSVEFPYVDGVKSTGNSTINSVKHITHEGPHQGTLRKGIIHSEPEKDQTDQVKKPVQRCEDLVISLQKQKQHERPAKSGPIHEKRSVEFPSVDGAKATGNSTINALKQVTGKGPYQETLRKGIIHREPVKDKKDQEKQLVHSCHAGASSQGFNKWKMESCSRTRQKLSWSELPEQSLKCIVKFIGNDVDTLSNFRSVCKNWRHSASYSIPRSLIVNRNLLSSSVLLLPPRDSSSSTPWMVTTVEIANGYTMFFHPFYGMPLINVPPNLKLSEFHVSSLSSASHTADFRFVHNLSVLFAPEKLLLVSCMNKSKNHLVKKVDYCDHSTDDALAFSNLIAYTLGSNGNLYKVSVSNFTNCIVTKKCSIIGLKKNVDDDEISYKKRLVRHPLMLKLYLVVRKNHQKFKVYLFFKIDARRDAWNRIEVHEFEDTDGVGSVLFVTRDTAFFASAKQFRGCQLRNCIVFSHDAFPPYSKSDSELPKHGPSIYVYQLGGTNRGFVPISSYRGFPCDLWSPPPWVLKGSLSQSQSEAEKDQSDQVKKHNQSGRDHDISLQKQKQHEGTATSRRTHAKQSIGFPSVNGEKETGNAIINALEHVAKEGTHHQETLRKCITHREPVKDKKDQEKQLAHSYQDGASFQEETQRGGCPLAGPISEKQTIEIHPADGKKETEKQTIEIHPADGEKETGTSTILHALKHVSEEGTHQETLRGGIVHSITSIIQSDISDSSTVKFEGLDVRSSLVPTLRKIWSEHGNIIENCLMRNGDIIARGLESLATVVLILEGNSAKSLSYHQADYLSSALFDLRCMRIQVDWLVPFVERAVELHKGKSLMDSFNKLSKLNDQVTKCRSALLDELAKFDALHRELKEDVANLSKKITTLGEMDLNLSLGGVLHKSNDCGFQNN